MVQAQGDRPPSLSFFSTREREREGKREKERKREKEKGREKGIVFKRQREIECEERNRQIERKIERKSVCLCVREKEREG